MTILEALILGLIQGLTEFFPVSSSGHIELGKAILGVEVKEDITFTIVVHGATVLSIIFVFYKDIWQLITDSLKFQWNESTQYVSKIAISMVPVAIVGVLFKSDVEKLFDGNIAFVGMMLLCTAIILALSHNLKKRDRNISYIDAFIIGIAQAIAVLPGISRSGATIATGLILGDKKEIITKFSFLMVVVPIIGANILELLSGEMNNNIGTIPLLVGFVSAFVSGVFACKWMISIVRKSQLIYFAIYCAIVGMTALFH